MASVWKVEPMDIQVAYETLREFHRQWLNDEPYNIADRLDSVMDYWDALDGWLVAGGALPAEWKAKR